MACEIVTIKNEFLTAEISALGAEMQSLKCDGKEYIWNGDPAFWADRAPHLFPICGGLKDDKYEFEGKEYTLNKHGYAKQSVFEVESAEADKAVFLLCSNDESRKMFPFDYELRIIYTLDGKSVRVKYSVLNKSNGEMYFSIGGHEGYMCPEGIEEYSLVFEKREHLTTNILHGNLLSRDFDVLGEDINELPLKYDYFSIDALTFLGLKSRAITLKHKKSNRALRVDFEGFDYVFVWTKPGAGYICIEPWCGIPDFEGTGYNFKEKIGIQKIDADETFERTHIITVEG